MIRPVIALPVFLGTLAACGGGLDDAAASRAPVHSASAASASGVSEGAATATEERGDVLAFSGQGNSGGVLTSDGEGAFSGVEATMAYNDPERRATSGANIEFHNGPLTGVGVNCARMGGGASVPECNTRNADAAYLVHEVHGSHAYAGSFSVQGVHGADKGDAFVMVHAPTSAEYTPLLTGTADYRGTAHASVDVTRDGERRSGRAHALVEITADFDNAALSGTMRGALARLGDLESADFEAGFTDARIDSDGRFFSTNRTEFQFDGDRAWGELDGGFYGPDGRELAGAYSFGNELGSMTGVMVGCETELNPTNCIQPVPRF